MKIEGRKINASLLVLHTTTAFKICPRLVIYYYFGGDSVSHKHMALPIVIVTFPVCYIRHRWFWLSCSSLMVLI